jgi:hypothetical protein
MAGYDGKKTSWPFIPLILRFDGKGPSIGGSKGEDNSSAEGGISGSRPNI